jgi:CBS domain-containing protein
MIGIPEGAFMADASDQQPSSQPSRTAATVADIMRPPVTTTVQQNDHVAAAAYLMKRADASALVVLDTQTDQPTGIITEADITRAVADGKDLNEARIRQLMTTKPAVIDPKTSIREAARAMTSGRFRHLPVVGEGKVIGMLDITDVCAALLDADVS